MARSTSAAAPATIGTCHSAVRSSLTSARSTPSIAVLLGVEPLLELAELRARQVPRLEKAHHEPLRRSAEEALEHVAHGAARLALARDGGGVAIGAVGERALGLPLPMQE